MNVIDIQLPSGEFLEVDKASVRLKVSNNLFSDTAIPAYYSFPFILPDTPKNRKSLGYKNLPESTSKLDDIISVKIFLKGNFFDQALLYINKFEMGWDVNLISGKQKRLNDIMELSMRSLDFGRLNSFNLQDLDAYVILYFDFQSMTAMDLTLEDTIGATFNVTYTEVASGTPQAFIDGLINQINADTALHSFTASQYRPYVTAGPDYTTWILLKSNGNFTETEIDIISTNVDVFALHSNLKIVPSTIPDWQDYDPITFHMNALADDEFRPLYESWFGAFDYRFPVMYNPLFDANEITPVSPPIVNHWNFAKQRYNASAFVMSNFYNTWFDSKVACVKLKLLFEAIGNTTGFKISTRIFDDPEYNELILISCGVIHYVDNRVIDIRLSMPDTTIGEFISSLRTLLGLHFAFDFVKGTINISFIKSILTSGIYTDYTNQLASSISKEKYEKYRDGFDLKMEFDSNDAFVPETVAEVKLGIIKAPVANFAALPSSSNSFFDIRFAEAERKYYYADVNPNTGTTTWLYLADIISNYRLGDAKNDITSIISPVSELKDIAKAVYDPSITPGTYEILMPQIKQPLKVKHQDSDQNTFGCRLAFYRGLQPLGSAGDLYPFATYGIEDYDGNVVGTRSLVWEGDSGLYQKNLKEWLNFLLNADAYYTFIRLTADQFINMNTSKLLRFESSNYLGDTVEIVFDNATQAIKPAKIVMYK